MLEAVYFIDVVSHNEMSQHLWTNSAYIYRIKDNWSDLLEKNLIKGDPFSEKGEEATHYKLRKAHISTFTELKDGSLQGLLGGYASDGSSTDAVLQSQYMYRGVSVLEELELRIMFVVDFYNDTWRTSMASFENSYMLFDDKKGITFSFF